MDASRPIPTALRRTWRLARFVAPDPVAAWRVRAIKRSGLFDRAFYRGINPGLHPLYGAFPERHYLLFGEAVGLRPSPAFSPRAYEALNPDLSVRSPLMHYVTRGLAEGRDARDPSLDPAAAGARPPKLGPPPAPNARHLAVVHVFYPELWEELSEALRASGLVLDLVVTIADRGEATAALPERVLRDWPHARTIMMPNRGRDVAPFMHLANSGWLDGYAAILKLHTKRSPHRPDGARWRRALCEGLLGPRVRARLAAFEADPLTTLWTADGMIQGGRGAWGVNEIQAMSLLSRAEVPAPDALRFPAGSMYWLKPLAVGTVRGLQLRPEEFELEQSQLDGTLAHAFERALGPLAEASGHVMRESVELDAARAPAAAARPVFVTAVYDPRHREPGLDPWLDVAGARPLFEGHVQPALPGPLGFYDPRDPDVLARHGALAATAGIGALAVRHHWSHGRTRWDGPMRTLLGRPDVAFPHHPLWTDEGLDGSPHAPGFEADLAHTLAPLLRDARCARPSGRPRLLVERAGLMTDPGTSVPRLRAALAELGVGPVELGVMLGDPTPEGVFDLHVLGAPDISCLEGSGEGSGPNLARRISSLDAVRTGLDEAMARAPGHTIPAIWAALDETPSLGPDARVLRGGHPAAFAGWLRDLEEIGAREVLVHAWNDWSRGAVLEPSARWGPAWLDVLAARCRAAADAGREDAA